MRFLLPLAVFLLALPAPAQMLPPDLVHAGYSWEAQRKRLPVSAAEAELPAVILKDFTGLEYYYDPRLKTMRLFVTEHRIVRVNTADGIEEFNKIVVPVLASGAPVEVKARTLSPRGEAREVRAADMKELKGDSEQRGFRVLAVDGVEKGSEVEYFYTRERPFEHYGREVLQGGTPAHNVTFELISPRPLTFETRTYHGPPAVADTTLVGHRALRLTLPDVAALRPEAFALPNAQRTRVEYKLAYIENKGQVRQFTWAEASQNIFRNLTTLAKDETKALAQLLAAAQVPAGGALPARIAAVENYVKLNISPEPSASPNIARIAATRTAPDLGFAHLLVALYRQLGIEHEIVLTTSRDDAPFDGTFDTWNYLDHFVLYFPGTGQYLAPSRPDCRLGLLPDEWTGQNGLFIRSVKLGSTESAVGSVKPIPALPAAASFQNLDLAVTFAPDLAGPSAVHLRQSLGGYPALAVQPFWSLIPAEKRTELAQNLQKAVVADATDLQHLEVRNGERGLNALEKPFEVECDLQSPGLLDKAGPRYLFKIGTLIGPQTELYQKEERQFDAENGNNHGYRRVIRFAVPAGYSVRNLAALNSDVKVGPDPAKPVFNFTSGYVQDGANVTVTITENYHQLTWPKADFEAFRSVVNAAANFNKVVLVLEKK